MVKRTLEVSRGVLGFDLPFSFVGMPNNNFLRISPDGTNLVRDEKPGARSNQTEETGNMKRVSIFIGIVAALTGTAIILPALANYGRPGAMSNEAVKFFVLGSLVAVAGGSAILHGVLKRKA